jgi:hypothetical protein
MSTAPYSVSVVLDRAFGSRFSELLVLGPVWIVDSPVNRANAEDRWAQFPTRNHLDGVTIFKAAENDSPEEMLIENLDTIDLRHGFYSVDHPYTVLEVVGARLTARIEAALTDLGFDSFPVATDGFRAIRPLAAVNKPVIRPNVFEFRSYDRLYGQISFFDFDGIIRTGGELSCVRSLSTSLHSCS